MTVQLNNQPNNSVAPRFARLRNLEERLNSALIDQPEAVHGVSEMIKRVETGFYDDTKPRGVLMFAGPTGVGKTELAKLTASELGVPLIRFDMSEFGEQHKVSRLLGSPAGYVDSDKGGELVNKLKETPKCVVLFDEIEKAHSDIFKVFLQLFDEGRLTDSMGREVNAKQAVFILTTNLGSKDILDYMRNEKTPNLPELENKLRRIFVQKFSPELYNRFEKLVIFRNLSEASIAKIGEKYLNDLKTNFAKKKIEITWDKKAVTYLSNLSANTNMGAREIHRKIKEVVLPKLTASRIEGAILDTDAKVHFDMIAGQLQLVVLDKGKITGAEPRKNAKPLPEKPIATEKPAEQEKPAESVPKEEEPRPTPPPKDEPIIPIDPEADFLDSGEPLALKNGIAYVNLTKRWRARELEKFFIARVDSSRTKEKFPHKMVYIDFVHKDSIFYKSWNSKTREDSGSMKPPFTDSNWRPVTPADSGWGFLRNLCENIESEDGKFASLLVNRIFTSLKKDLSLSDQPLESLREACLSENKTDLLPELDMLNKLLGPITVKILSNDPGPGNSDPRSRL